MDELKEAWVCKSPTAPTPRLKQSILINISCNESLLVRKKLKLFCLPRGSPWFFFFVFCLFLILACVMSFSGRPSWKKWRQNILWQWDEKNPLLRTVQTSRRSEQTEAKCVESPIAFKSTKQSGMAAHSPLRPQISFYARSTWRHAPSPPSRAHLTDRQSGWQLHITVPHCSLPYHFHYTVIVNYLQRWTGRDEWHIPTSRAATAWLRHVLASPASGHARQERAAQASGQGAALILNKCEGNPLPPSWLKTMCWNGRRYTWADVLIVCLYVID